VHEPVRGGAIHAVRHRASPHPRLLQCLRSRSACGLRNAGWSTRGRGIGRHSAALAKEIAMQRSCPLTGAFALVLALTRLPAVAAPAMPVPGAGLQPLDADALSAVSAGGLPEAALVQLGLHTRSGGATAPSVGDLPALALQQQLAALERQQALAQLRDATGSVRVATQVLWRIGTDNVVVPLAPLLLPLFPLPLPVLPPPPPKKH
jgi:hypothetical protein